MVTIIFESHATSSDNEVGIASGINDPDLSAIGSQQAQQLGQRYRHEVLDAVFCSDLKRSYRTAEIAFSDRNFKIIKDPRLRECNYGELNGAPKNKVETIKADYISRPFPKGESYEQTTEKMRGFLADLLDGCDEKKVMVIGSRATQYGLEHLINDITLEEAIIAPWQWQPGWVYYLRKI